MGIHASGTLACMQPVAYVCHVCIPIQALNHNRSVCMPHDPTVIERGHASASVCQVRCTSMTSIMRPQLYVMWDIYIYIYTEREYQHTSDAQVITRVHMVNKTAIIGL